MQRFVYSPKAYVFIKRRNGDVADVSRYCTAGTVERRVNAVSTANFTLRNPNMIFTASGGEHASFFPMDPVTIYLQRLKNRPVRVFTGFLDETPYYELYPGTIEFSASCTLKKLLYTYFDPALPYTQSFLAEYGWLPGPDGTIYNPEAVAGKGVEGQKDGGMGALLYATMTEIGHWNKSNIKIEKLPDDLIKRMTNMMRNFEEDNRDARAELETLITRFIGSGDYGNSGKDTSGGDDVDVSKYDGEVPEVIYQVGKAMGVPVKYMLSAFETGIVESGMKNLNYGDADSKGWRQERVSIYGESATDVSASAKRYFQECKQFDKGSGQTAGQLSADVQRPAAQYRGRYDAVKAQARALMEKTRAKVEAKDKKNSGGTDNGDGTSSGGGGGPEGTGQTTQAKRRDGRGDKSSGKDAENREKLSRSMDVHGAQAGMQVMGRLAESYGLKITAGKNDHGTMTASGNVSDHSTGSALDVSNGTAPTKEMDAFNKFVKEELEPITKQLIWRDTDQHNGYPIGGHMNHVHIALKPEFASNKTKTLNAVVDALAGRSIDVGAADDGTDDPGSTAPNDGILSRANATALAINLNWADFTQGQIESVALQGNKSLMNDKPLMPFIQQMAESSLRQFMSMPNGDFFAFYPDYFGETFHRPPYWIIDDIEVLEGRVRINDAALVTHEYVIGETSFTSDQLTNRLLSQGAISITNAFQSGLVTTDADKKKNDKDKATRETFTSFNRALKQDEAVQFLERYGARPDVQDFAFIRNPFFEMFMAYQRFMQAWSRQFISPFKLTFMPELYPGGKVGFPEHGLQMYVEEVTHTWDYNTGFVTEADMSSPAAMMDSKGQPLSDNLPPNMPTALLEVAVEKARKGKVGTTSPLITPGPNGQSRPN